MCVARTRVNVTVPCKRRCSVNSQCVNHLGSCTERDEMKWTRSATRVGNGKIGRLLRLFCHLD